MNKKIEYPKSISKLYEKLNFILNEEQNPEIIKNIVGWKKWFEKTNYEFNRELESDEYLKIFSENENYALQLWKHETLVDSILVTLIANHYNIYNDEFTIIKS